MLKSTQYLQSDWRTVKILSYETEFPYIATYLYLQNKE